MACVPTEGSARNLKLIFSNAVLWYAVFLYPGMQIETEDPRPAYQLRKLP